MRVNLRLQLFPSSEPIQAPYTWEVVELLFSGPPLPAPGHVEPVSLQVSSWGWNGPLHLEK